jgi:hypothetical protein
MQILDPQETYYINTGGLAIMLCAPFIKMCGAYKDFSGFYKERFFLQTDGPLDMRMLSSRLSHDLDKHNYYILDDILRDLRYVVNEPDGLEPRFSLRPVFVGLDETRDADGGHKSWEIKAEENYLPEYARIIIGYTLGLTAQLFLDARLKEKTLRPLYNELYRSIMVSCLTKDSDIITFFSRLQQDKTIYVDYKHYFGIDAATKIEFENTRASRIKYEKGIAIHVIQILEASINATVFNNTRHRKLWAYKLLSNKNDLYYQHSMLKAIYPDDDKLNQDSKFFSLNVKHLQNITV